MALQLQTEAELRSCISLEDRDLKDTRWNKKDKARPKLKPEGSGDYLGFKLVLDVADTTGLLDKYGKGEQGGSGIEL